MKVKARTIGVHDGAVRNPGDEFHVKDDLEIKPNSWMEVIDKSPTVKEPRREGLETIEPAKKEAKHHDSKHDEKHVNPAKHEVHK